MRFAGGLSRFIGSTIVGPPPLLVKPYSVQDLLCRSAFVGFLVVFGTKAIPKSTSDHLVRRKKMVKNGEKKIVLRTKLIT